MTLLLRLRALDRGEVLYHRAAANWQAQLKEM